MSIKLQVGRCVSQLVILSASLFAGCTTHLVRISGPAMDPVIADGDLIVVKKIEGPVVREDIVLCEDPTDGRKKYLLRVKGVPGDHLSVKTGQLLTNSRLPSNNSTENEDEAVLGNDTYFLMGDNRDHSYDSRYFGTVPRSKILSRFVAVAVRSKR